MGGQRGNANGITACRVHGSRSLRGEGCCPGWLGWMGCPTLQLDVVQRGLGMQRPCSGQLVAMQRSFSGRAVAAEWLCNNQAVAL